MSLRHIIFDMDDVLCHYDLGKRLRALSMLSGQTPRDIRAAIWDSGFEDASDAGQIGTADDYLAGFGERLGYALSREEWVMARKQAMDPIPEVLALASHLGASHDILIFTNNGPLLKETLLALFPEAHAIFGAHIYCSCEFATKKPDPAAYMRLLDRIGARSQDAWFIDDKKSNVEGARMAGLEATRFVSYEQLAADALARGLSLPPAS
jgi:putative hydrolase of the HAD superfamily